MRSSYRARSRGKASSRSGAPARDPTRWSWFSPAGRTGSASAWSRRHLVPVAEALPLLLAIDPNETGRVGRTPTRSVGVWAAAAAAGVGLVARGRLLPTVGADDVDVWRVGPLDPADLTLAA